MKGLVVCIGVVLLAVAAFGQESVNTNNAKLSSVESQKALVDQYCAGCHNDKLKSGGFSWTAVDLAHPERTSEQVEKIIRKVRSGMMPPAGARRPDQPTMTAFAVALENAVDRAGSAYAGAPELHRMNRTEYRNSVRDLLGIDADVTDLLPPDSRTNGFDNMAESLTITPALMSAYVRAADKISRDAIGDRFATPGMVSHKVSRLANQMRHVEGTPFGTRGGLSVMHTFPADGEYSFKADFYYYYTEEIIGKSLPAELQNQELEISVDGERVAVLKIDPSIPESEANYVTKPVKIAAGQRRLAAAFVAKFDGPVQDHYRLVEQTLMDTTISVTPEMTGLPHLQTISVTGPFNPTGISDSQSRRKIFTCKPTGPNDEEACVKQILSGLATKAFRRPTTTEDLESLMGYYQHGRFDGGFEIGVRAAIQAILAKPEFIFRFEQEPTNAGGRNYEITDLELASRLAYFLWSRLPDDELISVAGNGGLKNPTVLEKQVRRMLADPRSEALATNFASQWLRLPGLKDVFPEALLFPDFTRNLADAMRREVELLFDSIVREDRSPVELLTADYTFVNEVLAKHYGIPNVVGPRFKRVKLTDPNRFGLVGKGGILTMTSLANRTSPVSRGKYVLEVLLGSAPPAPPPVVPKLKEAVDNEKVQTVRERMEMHRKVEPCASCHKIMDPIGLALENFDATGLWRLNDEGSRIDASGEMFDGTKLDGPVSVRQAVSNHSDAFVATFTENLLAYSLGRVLDYHDMTTVRSIIHDSAKDGNRFSAFILTIVKSTPFRMRTASSN